MSAPSKSPSALTQRSCLRAAKCTGPEDRRVRVGVRVRVRKIKKGRETKKDRRAKRNNRRQKIKKRRDTREEVTHTRREKKVKGQTKEMKVKPSQDKRRKNIPACNTPQILGQHCDTCPLPDPPFCHRNRLLGAEQWQQSLCQDSKPS